MTGCKEKNLFLLLLFIAACNNDSLLKNAIRTETFIGTLPCADCPGITETLTLVHAQDKEVGRFLMKDVYLERDPSTSFISKGNWKAIKNKNGIHFIQLNPDKPEQLTNYIMKGDSILIDCGREEEPVDS